jgi:hypothetical protein
LLESQDWIMKCVQLLSLRPELQTLILVGDRGLSARDSLPEKWVFGKPSCHQ